jgi:hypothetical protein
MSDTTVRVSKETRQAVRSLATRRQVSQGELIAEAVESLRRQDLLKQANAAYATARTEEDAWREEQEEREAWDATLADGVER